MIALFPDTYAVLQDPLPHRLPEFSCPQAVSLDALPDIVCCIPCIFHGVLLGICAGSQYFSDTECDSQVSYLMHSFFDLSASFSFVNS